MNMTLLRSELERDEGRRHHAYRDSVDLLTIGVGHQNSDLPDNTVWTDEMIDAQLTNDITIAIFRAQRYCGDTWDSMSDARQRALTNMAFNLGNRLFAFVFMRDAIQAGDWTTAAKQALDSLWAHQVGDRATRIAQMIREG